MTNTGSTNHDWHCDDADEHGFVSYEYIQRKATGKTLEDFVAEFPVPSLVAVYQGGGASGRQVIDPNQSGIQLLTMSVRSAGMLRYLSRLAFVCKRPGNPFAHLISIGRSVSNDITLAVESVSKVHGYTVADEDGWRFTDHNSTNGSKLNGIRLDPGQKYSLRDGDVLQLGIEATVEFVTAESLFRRATKSR